MSYNEIPLIFQCDDEVRVEEQYGHQPLADCIVIEFIKRVCELDDDTAPAVCLCFPYEPDQITRALCATPMHTL